MTESDSFFNISSEIASPQELCRDLRAILSSPKSEQQLRKRTEQPLICFVYLIDLICKDLLASLKAIHSVILEKHTFIKKNFTVTRSARPESSRSIWHLSKNLCVFHFFSSPRRGCFETLGASSNHSTILHCRSDLSTSLQTSSFVLIVHSNSSALRFAALHVQL